MRKQTTTKATRKRRAMRKATDRDFREWVQKQPSCISGGFSEWVDGEGRNPACHVRTAATAGTAFKGDFACVPMTHQEHWDQHTHGPAGCLRLHRGGDWTRETAAEWFLLQARRYHALWLAESR